MQFDPGFRRPHILVSNGKITSKSSIMVGENFVINMSQMAKITSKSSTMVGENFVINTSQMAKITSKSSTMVL